MDLSQTLTKIGPNAARSSDGFTVNTQSRYEMEYEAGGKKLLIEVEPGEGLAVYRSSVRTWLPPHDKEELTDEEIATVIERVCVALKFLGIKYVLYF